VSKECVVIEERLRSIIRDALHLGERADSLSAESQLLGALPELDSMAVVTLITAVEEVFDLQIDDDEISAEVFEKFGSLADFVSKKVNGA
jgi:acyl carrier protein